MNVWRAGMIGCLVAAAWQSGCGSKQIPPGTPAPEYEPPVVTPWPPQDAQPEAQVEGDPSQPEPPDEQPASEPLDAGAAAPADGAAQPTDAGAVDAAALLPPADGGKR